MKKQMDNVADNKRKQEAEKLLEHFTGKDYTEPFILYIPETGFKYNGPLKECMDYFLAFIKGSRSPTPIGQLDTSIHFSGMRSVTHIYFELHYTDKNGFQIPDLRVRATGLKLDVARKVGRPQQIPSRTQIRDLVWVEKAKKNKPKRRK